MSKVVSFRLDEEHPEEREALAILEIWQEKGYSTREILTWALMALGGEVTTERQSGTETRETIDELRHVLGQAQEFLEALKDMKSMPDEVNVPSQTKPVLPDAFLASVRKVARPGLSLDNTPEQSEEDV